MKYISTLRAFLPLVLLAALASCSWPGHDKALFELPDKAWGGDTDRFDWRDAIVYSIVIDRFVDGDPSNSPGPESESNWRADPAAQWKGGDLKGILQTIEDGYFTDIGVNVLWLTPPFTNQTAVGKGVGINIGRDSAAYHGFWPKDLTTVDPRIGDTALFKRLITTAHEKGIKILVDYVMHHVSVESAVWRQRRADGWFWPLDGVAHAGWVNGLPAGFCVCHGDEDSGAMTPCGWDHAETTKRCWFATHLPTFNFNNAEARAFSVGNAAAWVHEFGFDGYRLDAIKHIEKQWLVDLRELLNRQGLDNFYLVGEVFSEDRKLVSAFIQLGRLLDGQFDFALRSEILKTVLVGEGSLRDLDTALDRTSEYGAQALMGTFIGNYDVPRVISLADPESRQHLGTRPDSWRRFGNGPIAWTGSLSVPADRAAFARVLLAYTVIMTNPGVPVVYYGDECGMPGAGDPDTRRMMQCFARLDENQQWLHRRMKRLTNIRSQEPALRRGSRQRLEVDDDLYVYRMGGGGGRDVFVMINRSAIERRVMTLPEDTYQDLLNEEMVKTPVDVPALSARVLVAK